MDERIDQRATDVRNNFSAVMDREPAVVHMTVEPGDSGKQIFALLEMPDIFEEAVTENEALSMLAADLLEYAQDFYTEFGLYSRSPNRKHHLPYVARALALGTPEKVREMIQPWSYYHTFQRR